MKSLKNSVQNLVNKINDVILKVLLLIIYIRCALCIFIFDTYKGFEIIELIKIPFIIFIVCEFKRYIYKEDPFSLVSKLTDKLGSFSRKLLIRYKILNEEFFECFYFNGYCSLLPLR